MEKLNLENNYYLEVYQEKRADLKAIAVEKINFYKFLKYKNIVLLIDFKNIEYKRYKRIIKKLLFLKKLNSNKLGNITIDSKRLLGYVKNYDKNNKIQNDFILGLNAIFYKTIDERYNYIYDTVCDYLDGFFYGKNFCDFKNNQCGEKRGTTSYIGCCHHYKNKILGPIFSRNLIPCEYLLEDYTCGAKCISCKLFTCDYLNKKGIKFRIKDIFLLNTFFNLLQKCFIKYMVFTPKDKIIKILLKTRIF